MPQSSHTITHNDAGLVQCFCLCSCCCCFAFCCRQCGLRRAVGSVLLLSIRRFFVCRPTDHRDVCHLGGTYCTLVSSSLPFPSLLFPFSVLTLQERTTNVSLSFFFLIFAIPFTHPPTPLHCTAGDCISRARDPCRLLESDEGFQEIEEIEEKTGERR
jgi:hypothetical protein